jgi:hypothetical protein
MSIYDLVDRADVLTKSITRDMRGIEIGPWFRPLCPKSSGYNCVVVDVYDDAELRRRAASDPNVPQELVPNIETVDLIGTSADIESLIAGRGELGAYDYVISSHNFEHLPNPINFLHGCSKILRSGGILSMALPDKRTSFDYFRPFSTTGQLIEAHMANRMRPTLQQVYDQNSLHSRYRANGIMALGFELNADPENIIALETVRESYSNWCKSISTDDTNYHDVHCWAFTPTSLQLILLDLTFLGLMPFEVDEITSNFNGEFYVRLRNVGAKLNDEAYYKTRQALLHDVINEISQNSRRTVALESSMRTLQSTVESMLQSRSWRLTAPLRETGILGRKLVKGLAGLKARLNR